jgi:hypothetical protein
LSPFCTIETNMAPCDGLSTCCSGLIRSSTVFCPLSSGVSFIRAESVLLESSTRIFKKYYFLIKIYVREDPLIITFLGSFSFYVFMVSFSMYEVNDLSNSSCSVCNSAFNFNNFSHSSYNCEI